MMSDDKLAQVETDLLSDRAKVPGSIEKWRAMDERSQRRWLKRLAQSESRRAEFEAALSNDDSTCRFWETLPITEQREYLASIDYLRFFLPKKLTIRQAISRIDGSG